MRYIAALLAAALLAGIPAGNAHAAESPGAGIGIRLADVPADVASARERSYVVEQVSPGESVERTVEVSNNSRATRTVKVYPGAADITGGEFTVADEGNDNDLAGWTSVQDTQLTLEPGAKKLVPVNVTVPADATEGERYGAVWAQVQDTESKSVQVSRVGVRLYISVGSGGIPVPDFSIASLAASRTAAGLPVVTAQVTNTGPLALDITGSIKLAGGPGGVSADPVPLAKAVTIAPGDEAEVRIELVESLPVGPWDATLSLHSGSAAHEISSTLTFPEAEPVPVEGGNALLAFLPIIIVLVIIAAGLLIGALRRKKDSRR
ncbi:DUF916 domain-containing protein [Arthrobacter caoxuetaonis]|uniref:DUF916 domain-containing protein n=1 Tax=Arthrobacter caoxuetaonis TaxID=2886935 RepID=A0A9X1MHJ3_9MICC|nr:DUF916 domain-containing protein [Arthrobacter caoxuetaonis]MCC3299340.1 DUF916 domain-containing protein [Arthrobacter caoxuetaonis]USQ59167.1 DUF916 domain-containing protein [Arthrobacter caoxuetaonis]